MAAGEPQQPDDNPLRRRSQVATSCQVIGAVIVIATLVCSLLGVISAQQAVALGLPAVVLILGGLIAVWVPDPQTSHRLGVRAGLQAGALLKLWRSLVRRRGRNS
jgi:uncharacterized membrane protein